MKRFLLILTCLSLLLLPALAETDTMPLAGTGYVGVWVEADGYGTLSILADGTARMEYYDGTITDTTWHLTDDGAAFGEGMWYNSPMVLLSEDVLSVSDGWMVFTRDGVAAEIPQIMPELTPVGEEGAPFLGTWRLDAIEVDGERYSPALLDMEMEFTLTADGLATVIIDGEEAFLSWFVSGPAVLIDLDMLLPDEEGNLVLSDEGAAMIFVPVPEETPAAGDSGAESSSAAPAAGLTADDYVGSWKLETIELEGEAYAADLFGMSMYITFHDNGTATTIEDGESASSEWRFTNGFAAAEDLRFFIDAQDRLIYAEEDGMMIFVRTDSVPDAVPVTPDDPWLYEEPTLPEELQGFIGTWYMCYCQTGGLTGDLRTIGVTATLELYDDGTGYLSGIAEEFGVWYEDEGIVRFGESGMPMTLLGDAGSPDGLFLQYGSTMGGYMIFSQNESAMWDPALLAAPETPAEAPAAPASSSAALQTDVKYICTSYTSAGFTLDASTLGAEYALVFHGSSTVDFTVAGFTAAGLPCSVNADGQYIIDYYGNAIPCTPTDTGIDLDYFGAMTMHFVPAE